MLRRPLSPTKNKMNAKIGIGMCTPYFNKKQQHSIHIVMLFSSLFLFQNVTYAASPAPLSVAEQQALDLKLQQAMALYYDKSYHLALPLFQEISRQVDTLDLQYWMGQSALALGQLDTAIQSFQAMLARDDNLPKVRLELAMAYLKKGEKKKAQKELDKLLTMSPPENLRQQIESFKKEIELLDKNVFVSLRGSIGYQYDSNVNVQPDVESVQLANGGRLSNTKAKADHALVTNLNLDVTYDLKRNSLIWRNRVSYYGLQYRHESDYNYNQVDLRTSLEQYKDKYRWRLPMGYVDKNYSGKQLSHALYIEPSFDYVINSELDWTMSYRYESEKFYDPIQRGQNNQTSTLSFGPRAQLKNSWGNSFVIAQVSIVNNDTKIPYLSFREFGIGPSYFTSIESLGIDVMASGKYAKRQYASPNLFLSPEKRVDDRTQLTLMISKNLNKKLSLSASYSFSKTQSNLPLYEYKKSVFGVNLGFNLD